MKLYLIGAFGCLGIYLFVSAPPPLPEKNAKTDSITDTGVSQLFKTANAINEAARLVYTKRIVGAGKKAGLKFGEDWNEPGVEKGPLPALFLRLVSKQLERRPEPLGLYLGSDEPINKSNLFSKDQMQQFAAVKESLDAQFSLSETDRSVAMFPDLATVEPCVVCHNEHKDSPKTDWKIGDVMGATTWTYPAALVSQGELLVVSKAVYASVSSAYQEYLAKASAFNEPIVAGTSWPDADNRTLPDVDTFMTAVLREAGVAVATEILLQNQTQVERKS